MLLASSRPPRQRQPRPVRVLRDASPACPGRLAVGFLYPAALFALWHVSPTSIRGSAAVLVSAAAYLGLVYDWIAWRTGTIRYTIPAHIAVNGMALSFALLVLGR